MIVDLKDKKGLIIGIANDKSIAYGCANKCREAGADLAITYLNAKSESYVRPLAEKLGSKIIVPLDVQNEEQLKEVFSTISKKWGKLDFLLHAIAFAPREDLHNKLIDCSKEGFLQSLDISCYSFINLAKLAAPLISKGGSIMTVTYHGSTKVVPNYDLMGVAKAALEAAVRYLAYNLGEFDIRVNAISPGPIMTRAASGISNFDILLNQAQQKSPLRRSVDLNCVGNTAAFLFSQAAKDITGTIQYIDTGSSIMV